MEPIWTASFIGHTYSCIKKREIHKLAQDVKKALITDAEGTIYCLKIDVIEYSGYFQVHFIYKNKPYSINSRNKALHEKLKSKQYPVNFKIRKYVRAKEN